MASKAFHQAIRYLPTTQSRLKRSKVVGETSGDVEVRMALQTLLEKANLNQDDVRRLVEKIRQQPGALQISLSEEEECLSISFSD